jgi:hypothetical protein
MNREDFTDDELELYEKWRRYELLARFMLSHEGRDSYFYKHVSHVATMLLILDIAQKRTP